MRFPIILTVDKLTPLEKEKVNTARRYPKINHTILAERDILKEYGIEDPFFGIPLDIELKRDGSNLRLIYLGRGRFGLLSRNQYACNTFIKMALEAMKREPAKWIATLLFSKIIDGIIFLELFGKGNSPIGFDRDSPISLEIIDIYVPDSETWLPRKLFEEYLPTVPLVKKANVKTRVEYATLIRECLEWCDAYNKEGVVIKGVHSILGRIVTKEKVAKALEKPKKQLKPKEPDLPVLNISEVMGAINKVHANIGDAIWEKKIAMPLIAIGIKEECKKHSCSAPRNFFAFYMKYLDTTKH